MFKLEHGEKDAMKSKNAAPIIDRLQDQRERWRDDYASNRLLRDQFRVISRFQRIECTLQFMFNLQYYLCFNQDS